MSEDDLPSEIHSLSLAFPETHLLFRLTPTESSIGRYIALIAAEDEKQARRFAADADPFGSEWENPTKYICSVSEDASLHVVGDVVFRSVPDTPDRRRSAPS